MFTNGNRSIHGNRANARQKLRQQNRRKTSPDYGVLEPRLALTVFVVTTPVDVVANDGVVSMREATIAANTNAAINELPAGSADGDVITFAPDVTGLSLSDEIYIRDDVFIKGGSGVDDRIELRPTNYYERNYRFNIVTNEHVTLDGISIFRGSADNGGAIYFSGGGSVTVRNSYLGFNSADIGGAVFQNGGVLNIVDSTLQINSAWSFDSPSAGAIYSNSGIVNLSGSTIERNQTGGHAGAIFLQNSRLNAVDVTFGPGNYNGGFVAKRQGGTLLLGGDSTANIRDSEFLRSNAGGDGGAIWMSSQSFVSVSNTLFESNYALRGGAIFNDGGDLLVRDSVFESNWAGGNPDDESSGGALFLNGGYTKILDTTFEDNLSYTGGGGAINAENARLFIDGGSFLSNEAGRAPSPYRSDGGAVRLSGETVATFAGVDLEENTANDRGGAIKTGAGVNLSLRSSSLEGNRAKGRDVGDGGGGIFAEDSTISTTYTYIRSNEAREGGGIYLDGGSASFKHGSIWSNQVDFNGGGMKVVDGSVNTMATGFRSNVAGRDVDRVGNGGAIYLSGESRLVGKGEKATGRNASYIENGYWSTTFSYNSADNGGAIWIGPESSAALSNFTTLRSNSAVAGSGGGIFNWGHVRSTTSIFIENSASTRGGGMFVGISGTAQLYSQTQFTENSADEFGGALFNDGFFVSRGTSLIDNTAVIDGDDFFDSFTGNSRLQSA